jgi:hypothetical protein
MLSLARDCCCDAQAIRVIPWKPILTGWPGLLLQNTDRVDFGGSATLYVQGDWSAGLWVYLPSNAHGALLSMVDAGLTDPTAAAPYVLTIPNSTTDARGNLAFPLMYVHDYGTMASVQGHEYLTSTGNPIPANRPVYVAASRSAAAKTVSFYWGDGTTLHGMGSAGYSHTPGIAPGLAHCTVGAFYYGNLTNTPANDYFYPVRAGIMRAYLWSANLTQQNHIDVMQGNPVRTGALLLAEDMTVNPVANRVPGTTAPTGTVYGGTVKSFSA